MPTSQSENAYWPTWYETCRSLNHDVRWSSCSDGSPNSNFPAAVTQTPTSSREISAARAPSQ